MVWKSALSSILLGLGVGVALGYVIAPPHSETERQDYERVKAELTSPKREEDFCDRIPEKILGASSVKRCEENAKYVLVHIRQIHDAESATDDDNRKIIIVQKEIYQLLLHLKENYGVDEVYSEGNAYGGGLENSLCRLAETMKETHYTIEQGTKMLLLMNQYDNTTSKEEKERIRREAEIKYGLFKKIGDNEYQKDLTFLTCGADRILEMEGKIRTLVGEDFQTYRTACEDTSNKDYVMRKREDALLEIVAAGDKPLNVTVFGGSHRFEDNILEWNSLHPNQKFSLMTVTPASYSY